MKQTLERALRDLADLLPRLAGMEPALTRLGEALMRSWQSGGKVLIAGNGGSAADAMHFAEELIVRFGRSRRALGAVALCDPTVLTCAGNDLGFEQIFSRQVEGLGRAGDILIVLSTSGNSRNLVRAVESAQSLGLVTAAFLGKDGGAIRGMCQIELHVPSSSTARIQEAHKLLFHTVCEWVESKL